MQSQRDDKDTHNNTHGWMAHFCIIIPSHTIQHTARGERLKEATVEAKRVIDQYREEKEKQFKDFVSSVRLSAHPVRRMSMLLLWPPLSVARAHF
jgi:hypothetical protein